MASDLNSALMEAVKTNSLAEVSRLLSIGADCQWRHPDSGSTALHLAIQLQQPAVTNVLVRHLISEAQRCPDQIDAVSLAITTAIHPSAETPFVAPPSVEEETKDARPLEQRVEDAIAAIARGEFVVVVDDEDRENEGDLIIAAEKVTPEKIAFMVNETTGIICVTIEAERAAQLQLPQMVERNTESHGTAFTHSVDYKHGTTTGVSAHDRTATIRALASSSSKPSDFSRPGHIFPLRARDGGVLVRPGHTEASVDLARMAGLYPAGTICEIVNKDGSMMRAPDLKRFAKRFGFLYLTIEDLIAYRKQKAAAVPALPEVTVTTAPRLASLSSQSSLSSSSPVASSSSVSRSPASPSSSAASASSHSAQWPVHQHHAPTTVPMAVAPTAV